MLSTKRLKQRSSARTFTWASTASTATEAAAMPYVSRRQLLGLALSLAAKPVLARAPSMGSSTGLFLSAASTRDDTHWVKGIRWQDEALIEEFALPLPERGHHVEIHPEGRYFVMVARRPGTWLVIGDAERGE